MKVKIDTGKPQQEQESAAWVTPAKVDRAEKLQAVRELRALGLASFDVRRLLRRLAEEVTAAAIVATWPTVTEDKATLRAAAELAQGLAEVLGRASPRASAELATAGLQGLGNCMFPDSAAEDLSKFAAAVRLRIESMPDQTRREAPKRFVRAVRQVAGHKLGAETTYPEGAFRRACVAAFALAGVWTSPDAAIRAVVRELNDRSAKRDANPP